MIKLKELNLLNVRGFEDFQNFLKFFYKKGRDLPYFRKRFFTLLSKKCFVLKRAKNTLFLLRIYRGVPLKIFRLRARSARERKNFYSKVKNFLNFENLKRERPTIFRFFWKSSNSHLNVSATQDSVWLPSSSSQLTIYMLQFKKLKVRNIV